MKSNLTFTWYHYYKFIFNWLYNWKNFFNNDTEKFIIGVFMFIEPIK